MTWWSILSAAVVVAAAAAVFAWLWQQENPTGEPLVWHGLLWALGYIAFVLALTSFAIWGWPRLGPWIWSHI